MIIFVVIYSLVIRLLNEIFYFCSLIQMKFKLLFFILCGFALIGLVTNSCKKNQQDYIQTLFTQGKWQLSTMTVTHKVGASTVSEDTLNTLCDSTQVYKFNIDNTCTYTNFDCLPQKASGHWSLSKDRLILYSDMVCQDTTAATSSKPFQVAKIINLGQYSLVLQTGDLETYYTPTQVRTITQYGFVRQKTK